MLGILAVVMALAALLPGAARATEAVAGRYVPGVFAIPVAGITPPPGVCWLQPFDAATSSS